MRSATVLIVLSAWTQIAAAAAAAPVWTFDQGSGTYVAGTSNESGETFGQACYVGERKCYWLLGLKRPCNPGAAHSVLANSDAGASTFRINCMGPSEEKGLYRYSVNEFDAIDSFVANATKVGFALPLQGDQFALTRFDLTGSKAVVDAMRQAAQKQMQETSPK